MIKKHLIPAINDRSAAISELIKRWIKKDRQATNELLPIPLVPEKKFKHNSGSPL